VIAPADYLEAAKLEELSADLVTQGYEIVKNPQDTGFDLVATRGGKTVAFQVKARSHLREAAPNLRYLREQARQHGFDFHLVVVNPPREKTITFEGLETILFDYLTRTSFSEIEQLAPHISFTTIRGLNIDALTVTKDTIRVTGTGLVDVQMGWSGDEKHNGITINSDFPFYFNIILDHNFEIEPDSADIKIDTSSFFE
jgi:hypothetical protein